MYAQSMSNTRLSNEPRSLLSRGGPALAVIGIHVAIIYGLATTMGIVNIPKFAEPIVPPAETAVPASENAIAATEASGAIAQDLKTSNRVEPTYPSASRRAGEEGTVRLKVLVDEKGRPRDVTVADTDRQQLTQIDRPGSSRPVFSASSTKSCARI